MSEVKVTVLPPGRAEGWNDLQFWTARQMGVPESVLRKKIKRENKARKRRLRNARKKHK